MKIITLQLKTTSNVPYAFIGSSVCHLVATKKTLDKDSPSFVVPEADMYFQRGGTVEPCGRL